MSAVQPSPEGFDLYLRDALADCVSKFHQLLYISRYWNPDTGLYVDPASSFALSDNLSVAASRMHTIIFEDWLACSLAEQSTEFHTYLETLSDTDREALLRVLSRSIAREGLASPNASQEAQALFSSDLKILVTLAQT